MKARLITLCLRAPATGPSWGSHKRMICQILHTKHQVFGHFEVPGLSILKVFGLFRRYQKAPAPRQSPGVLPLVAVRIRPFGAGPRTPTAPRSVQFSSHGTGLRLPSTPHRPFLHIVLLHVSAHAHTHTRSSQHAWRIRGS